MYLCERACACVHFTEISIEKSDNLSLHQDIYTQRNMKKDYNQLVICVAYSSYVAICKIKERNEGSFLSEIHFHLIYSGQSLK